MLTPLKFFFCVIKTHINDMVEFVLIKIRFNFFIFSLPGNYFFIFLQENFIHCTVNNRIFLLMPVKFISWHGIIPAVLSGTCFNILRTKFSQDLAFILRMTGDIYETCGFVITLWVIYISFPALSSALTHL